MFLNKREGFKKTVHLFLALLLASGSDKPRSIRVGWNPTQKGVKIDLVRLVKKL